MQLSILFAAVTVLTMLALGAATTKVGDWYRNLGKPAWTPPDWLLPPAWTVILGLAGWAGVLAWTGGASDGGRSLLLICFGANVGLHMLWSPLFFNLRRPDWALIEVGFLWLSVVAIILVVAPPRAWEAGCLRPTSPGSPSPPRSIWPLSGATVPSAGARRPAT